MAGVYYQDNMDTRYRTPDSFRTGRVVQQPEPPDTPPTAYRRREAEPEPEVDGAKGRDGGESQQRDSKMSNQVFGNTKPNMEHSMKPEPYQQQQMRQDGYEQSPRRYQEYHDDRSREQRQDVYQPSPRRYPEHYDDRNREQRQVGNQPSPRRYPEYYDDRAYRSGRPDLGPAKDSYVPYPQEPLNRRIPGQNWMQPPSIGFMAKYGPHGSEDNPKPHPGWIVLMRFNKDGEDQVQRALYMCQKHIDADGGRIMGLARSRGVKIREGGENWVTYGKLRHFGAGVWNPQESPLHDDTQYCVLAVYYPSLSRAKQWIDRDPSFKQKDFPKPYSADCIALPLSSSVDTGFNKTLVMSMYSKISNAEYFRKKFSLPTENMMLKRFRSTPYVVKATYIPVGDDSKQRVARHLRGMWLSRNSIITVSMFDSLQETNRYFTDPEYYEAKRNQDDVSAPTTIVMDLEDWRPQPGYYGR